MIELSLVYATVQSDYETRRPILILFDWSREEQLDIEWCPARMEGLANRHQGVREGCSGGGADLRAVLPPGPTHTLHHKVLTYVEYRAVSGVFQSIDPPPPSSPSECVLPPHQRRGGYWGTHSPGGGGSVFWKMSDIGLASCSINSLRALPMDQIKTPNPKCRLFLKSD